MKKFIIVVGLALSSGAWSASDTVDLGEIKEFEILVSCPSSHNEGIISSDSIIENFNIVGSNESTRRRKSGCQSNQSYPLFVKDQQLHMRVKFIDAHPDMSEEERIRQMEAHGSIALGEIKDINLPKCDGPGLQWHGRVKVKALPGLKIQENIVKKKENGRKFHLHNMTISDGEHKIDTVGWSTKKARASKSEERFCYFK